MTITRVIVRALLPVACAWAQKHEQAILRTGVALDDQQLADARRIGVLHPERIRILVVRDLPPRLRLLWGALAHRLGLAPPG